MKNKTYEWDDVYGAANSIAQELRGWKPDYIVGITRGGLVLSVVLSHMLKVRMYTLDVSLRDSDDDMGPESNCWMAEDAFGYECVPDRDNIFEYSQMNPENRKKILIVDDINDTGATFNWIKNDWMSSCLPNHEGWNDVWGGNVRFAVMTQNEASNFNSVSYYYDIVNKAEEDIWLQYPWE